jgi:hypothetical protein
MENGESDHVEQRIGTLQRQLAFQRRIAFFLTLLWLASLAWITVRTGIPPVLAVERLEIVEPDGKPAFVLANSQRPIACCWERARLPRGIAPLVIYPWMATNRIKR